MTLGFTCTWMIDGAKGSVIQTAIGNGIIDDSVHGVALCQAFQILLQIFVKIQIMD